MYAGRQPARQVVKMEEGMRLGPSAVSRIRPQITRNRASLSLSCFCCCWLWLYSQSLFRPACVNKSPNDRYDLVYLLAFAEETLPSIKEGNGQTFWRKWMFLLKRAAPHKVVRSSSINANAGTAKTSVRHLRALQLGASFDTWPFRLVWIIALIFCILFYFMNRCRFFYFLYFFLFAELLSLCGCGPFHSRFTAESDAAEANGQERPRAVA